MYTCVYDCVYQLAILLIRLWQGYFNFIGQWEIGPQRDSVTVTVTVSYLALILVVGNYNHLIKAFYLFPVPILNPVVTVLLNF